MSDRQFAFVCTERDINPSVEEALADLRDYERDRMDHLLFHPEDVTIDAPDDYSFFHPEGQESA